MYNRERFQLRPESGDGLVLNLQNVFDDYRQTMPQARPAFLEQVVEAWISVHRRKILEDFAEARRNLLPVVRPKTYAGLVALQSQIDGTDAPEIPCAALNDELILGVVYQMPGAARIVTADLLDGWNVTLYETLEVARKNLVDRGKPPFSSPIRRLYVCDAGDSYDATRIACRHLIALLPVEGEHVVMAPNRDMLLVSGTHEPAALVVMAMLADHGLDDARHISGVAFRLANDELIPWLPEQTDELYAKFQRLRLKSAANHYADQGVLLQQLHAQTGENAEIAEFDVIEVDEKGPFSRCVWKQGLSQLLPKTEKIVFETRAGNRLGTTTWNDAAVLVPELRAPMNIFPERYRVEHFPSPDCLELLASPDS
ncbi:MAG TPA: hypothetical protein VFI31_08900 [Pirellulales bacterium]|nr:hypothetical protein [Pirellulales bacterium]